MVTYLINKIAYTKSNDKLEVEIESTQKYV
jgi:hypothetical protein